MLRSLMFKIFARYFFNIQLDKSELGYSGGLLFVGDKG